MPARYVIDSNGTIGLVAATAKSVLSYIVAANATMRVTEVGISFDGTVAANAPVLVELMQSTQAGTGVATPHTPVQVGGAARTVQGTGARNFSSEPTALTAVRRWLVHPQSGLILQFPLGREPEQNTTSDAMLLRCTAPAAVNTQAYMEVEEG